MNNRNSRISKWALLLLVPIVVLAVMWPIARERRKIALTQQLITMSPTLNLEEMKALVAQGADVNGKSKEEVTEGGTALNVLARSGVASSFDQMSFLLQQGTDINARDADDYTPLMRAANFGYVLTVKFLLEHGAAVNARINPRHRMLRGLDGLVTKKSTALGLAKSYAQTKAAKSIGFLPQLKETIRILKAAGAKE